VERLLQDCRSLLALDGELTSDSPFTPLGQDDDQPLAA
jgi:hypothetical protein